MLLLSVRVKLVAALARAAGENGMVGGQMRDIEAESKGFENLCRYCLHAVTQNRCAVPLCLRGRCHSG